VEQSPVPFFPDIGNDLSNTFPDSFSFGILSPLKDRRKDFPGFIQCGGFKKTG